VQARIGSHIWMTAPAPSGAAGRSAIMGSTLRHSSRPPRTSTAIRDGVEALPSGVKPTISSRPSGVQVGQPPSWMGMRQRSPRPGRGRRQGMWAPDRAGPGNEDDVAHADLREPVHGGIHVKAEWPGQSPTPLHLAAGGVDQQQLVALVTVDPRDHGDPGGPYAHDRWLAQPAEPPTPLAAVQAVRVDRGGVAARVPDDDTVVAHGEVRLEVLAAMDTRGPPQPPAAVGGQDRAGPDRRLPGGRDQPPGRTRPVRPRRVGSAPGWTCSPLSAWSDHRLKDSRAGLWGQAERGYGWSSREFQRSALSLNTASACSVTADIRSKCEAQAD
jgi:hypothetical protein